MHSALQYSVATPTHSKALFVHHISFLGAHSRCCQQAILSVLIPGLLSESGTQQWHLVSRGPHGILKCSLSSHRVLLRVGNFFSAAFEDTCLALVGASGGVFGMVGLFIADMVVNFASIRRYLNLSPEIRAPCATQRIETPCLTLSLREKGIRGGYRATLTWAGNRHD